MRAVAIARIRQSPLFRSLRTTAKRLSQLHIPVAGFTRPVFVVLYSLHVFVREGVIWFVRFFWFEPLFRSQCEEVGRRLQIEQLPYVTGAGRIVIGADVRLSGKSSIGFASHAPELPVLVIGDATFVGHNCAFMVSKSITIGKHCLLAGGVRLSDFDGHPIDAGQRRANQPTPADAMCPVTVGDDVWIGAGAVVLKGVSIGDRSIIGAGSVVTRDVPPDVVAAGNPAKVVKALR